MDPKLRAQAGHYEILGETYAKFEFINNNWNPYSRFLDVDKVDFILRRNLKTGPIYREVQVKFGKLYEVKSRWERDLFDVTSWRFFKEDEFEKTGSHLFVAYVLSRDDRYDGDFFIFPIREFESIIHAAPVVGKEKDKEKHRVYISHCLGGGNRWVLRKETSFHEITNETCLDVTKYHRNFGILEPK